MKFYTQQHAFYCGVDLHARMMYLCILDHAGKIVLHRNMASAPEAFLAAIAPYREQLAVGVECMFCWYWLADLCAREKIAFILGHALYMRAIYGGKCVFHAKPATSFTSCRPLISRDAGQSFHACRPPPVGGEVALAFSGGCGTTRYRRLLFLKGDGRWRKRGCPCGRFEKFCG